MNYQFAKTISKPNKILQKSFNLNNKQILDATQIRIRIRRQSDHLIESQKIKRLNNIAPITRVQQLLKAKRKRFVKLRLHCSKQIYMLRIHGKVIQKLQQEKYQQISNNLNQQDKKTIKIKIMWIKDFGRANINSTISQFHSKKSLNYLLQKLIDKKVDDHISRKTQQLCLFQRSFTQFKGCSEFINGKKILQLFFQFKKNRLENLIQFSEESEQQQLPQKSKYSIEKPKVKINQAKYLIRKSSYTIQNYVSNRTGLPKLEMKPSLMDYFQQLNSARQAYQTPTNERIKTQESQHSFRQKNMFRRLKPYLQK